MTWFDGLLGAIQQDGEPVELAGGLNFISPLVAALNESTGVIDVELDATVALAFSQVQSDGINQTTRAKLNFLGFTLTDDPGNDALNVAIGEPSEDGLIPVYNGSTSKWEAGRTVRRASIGATALAGRTLHNPTPSAIGAPQFSPANVLQGEVSTSGDVRREIYARTQVWGIEGASVTPVWILALDTDTEGTLPDNAPTTPVLAVTPTSLQVFSDTGGLKIGSDDADALRRSGTTLLVAGDFSDADFGDANVLLTGSLSVGSGAAGFGGVRLAKSESNGIWSNNDAGNNNVLLLAMSGSGNAIILGGAGTVAGASAPAEIVHNATVEHEWRIADVPQLVIDGATLDAQDNNIVTTGLLAVGVNPATSGIIRIPENQAVVAWDGAANRQLLELLDDAGSFVNYVHLGNTSSPMLVDAGTNVITRIGGTAKAIVDGNGFSTHELRVGTGTTPGTDDGFVKIQAGSGASDGMIMTCQFPSGERVVLTADETSPIGNIIAIGGTANVDVDVAIITDDLFAILNRSLQTAYQYSDSADTHEWRINNAIKMTLNSTLLVLASGHTVDFGLSDTLGGGATATLGTIGGSGPTAAAQSKWLEVKIGGTTHWIPAWV